MATNPFAFCDTEREVLGALTSTPMVYSVSPGLLDAAQARLAEIRKIDELKKELKDFFDPLNAKKKLDPRKKPEPEPEAAVIEFVEHRGAVDGALGVSKPDTVVINGTPVLVPRDDFISWDYEDHGLVATVRMYARRVVIGEPV